MKPLLLTFTNLFPSSVMPTHGIFVYERMRRVAASMPEVDWQVVAPVPHVPWFLRNAAYRKWSQVPERETWGGVVVHHPRFRHWPGLSVRRQAAAVRDGTLQLVRELCTGRSAVLDAHYVWPDGVAAADLAEELGIPFTVTARGTDVNVIGEDPVIQRRIAAIAPRAHRLWAVSRALADRFAHVAGLDAARVDVARNGVDTVRFRVGDKANARAALGLPQDARLLLGVGRLVSSKGFGAAVDALQRLPSDVQLVLVGEGPQRSELEARSGGRVRFLGPLPPDKVAEACRACDVFVLPSEREGWPNVVTEALASGLPVVATRVGGVPEILGDPPPADGSRGALVPYGDQAALVHALEQSLACRIDPQRIRAHAEQFGWDPPVQQLVATFRAALQRAGAALPEAVR